MLQSTLDYYYSVLKLSGATVHEGQGLLCPSQYTWPLGAEVHEQMSRPDDQYEFTCRNCGGGDRGGVAIYRPFGEFRRAESYCHLYGAQGQRQAYLLPMPR
ncbi:hypothetical protein TNCV_967771 [Trichonephila clavipes]|nr:hypothetical protein TNCV_967771 [Trichonephila clavipes]